MTQASNTAELPGRRPGRAAQAAALFMFVHWLIEHPEIPMPTDIMATWRLEPGDEIDQATRYAAVTAVAEQLDATQYGTERGARSPQFDYVVAAPDVHGLAITYRGSTLPDEFYGRPL